MNLQQLYYFRELASCEHYTKASEKLFITQSTLSHSIADLEAELGIKLFEKQGRNIKLTKYGEIFLEYAAKSLDTLEEGRAKINDLIHPDSGTISLGYFSSLEEFLPYLVDCFYAETNKMQTLFQFQQLPNNQIEERLLAGKVDLAFATHINNDKLHCHKIGTHNLALIVSRNHALSQKDSVDLSELQAESFITYDYQCRIRFYIDEIFDLAGIKPKIFLETTHDAIIYKYVAANCGVGLVPEPFVIKNHNVKSLRIENEMPLRDIFIIWKNVKHISPAVKKFLNFVVKLERPIDEFRNAVSAH
ncbi:MAG: LysR family transcriptional regulator [Spirochaetes bacterium]|nr:LysR family transcriptional regulator [Spirochaetota bacterium]